MLPGPAPLCQRDGCFNRLPLRPKGTRGAPRRFCGFHRCDNRRNTLGPLPPIEPRQCAWATCTTTFTRTPSGQIPKYCADHRGLAARRNGAGTLKREVRSRENREIVASLKVKTGCTDCGYRGHSAALEYDHRPGTDKVVSVSKLVSRGRRWDQIAAEIAKCDVVCANCHRIRTANRRSACP